MWEAVREQLETDRSARALQNRWMLIAKDVATFAECLAGEEDDGEEAVERALGVFAGAADRSFEFLECWRRVKHCAKFKTQRGESASPAEAPASSRNARVEPQQPRAAVVRASAVTVAASTASAASAAPTTRETRLVALRPATSPPVPPPPPPVDLVLMQQQQLASELRRKNDLREEEMNMRLFGEARQSEESQRFFTLLKRKKLLLLEREVDELEKAQQRRRLG